jgi:hypothetical protein
MLILSRNFAEPFNRWTRAKPIPGLDDLAEPAYTSMPSRVDFLVMLAAGIANVWFAVSLSKVMPEYPPLLTQSSWLVLLVTTGAIAISFTPLRRSRQAEFPATLCCMSLLPPWAQAHRLRALPKPRIYCWRLYLGLDPRPVCTRWSKALAH